MAASLVRTGTTYAEGRYPAGLRAYAILHGYGQGDLRLTPEGIRGYGPREVIVDALRRAGTVVVLADGDEVFVSASPEAFADALLSGEDGK